MDAFGCVEHGDITRENQTPLSFSNNYSSDSVMINSRQMDFLKIEILLVKLLMFIFKIFSYSLSHDFPMPCKYFFLFF